MGGGGAPGHAWRDMFNALNAHAQPAAKRGVGGVGGVRQRRRGRGFTLIEQAAVVAALGVLSATALPRLAELRSDAQGVALAAVAGAVGSAMLLNQGACAVRSAAGPADACITVRDCSQASALLATPLPAGYQLLPQPLQPVPGSAGPAQADCVLLHRASGGRASFRGLSAGG